MTNESGMVGMRATLKITTTDQRASKTATTQPHRPAHERAGPATVKKNR